ncbi:aldehyde dehydrogenase (NADP(+)) [Nonomuraea sp. NPDC050328]|uniref:aldehyde dehydrogenase (NADP(+)) n=1 Tax=Nonomuraea sp. NPDC050328 TaxID=3364361 RepID=UPI0037BD6031
MIYAYNPRTGERFGDPVPESGREGVDAALAAAAEAGARWRATPASRRAEVLDAIGAALTDRAEDLWPLADQETALGETRLRGEIARAAGQFRFFAEVLRDGAYLQATIEHADGPKPDLRRMLRPLPGVAAVFAASNFPFAFSVAGGDTASALAAGCPVVVKAHPAHPLTSELSAEIIRTALPDPALLGLVHGLEEGRWLVQDERVAAVGFTGSIPGGKAIQALIAERETPVPFFGELGSVNPVVILPSARRDGLAQGFAGSLTLGTGQFCTNPGLVFVPEGSGLVEEIADAVAGSTGTPMLSERIRDGYLKGRSELPVLAEGQQGEGAWAVAPRVHTVDLDGFAARLPEVAEECFGPSSVIVTYRAVDELPAVLARLDGSLTATVHAGDPAEAGPVAEVLGRTAGRLIWNGWPTGVAVSWAMHHGGPWPASTSPAHTSVGASAIDRWLVPASYQDWPEELLPEELREANPLGVPRRVDGRLER